MSTKIYDGFKFKAKNLDEVLFILNEFSQKAEVKCQEIAKMDLLDDISAMIDESFLNMTSSIKEEERGKRFLSLAKDNVKEKIKSDEVFHGDINLDIAILVYKKNYLGIPFSQNNHVKELIQKESWYEEYGYWNNTDRPDFVEPRAWSRRKKVWDGAFGNEFIPSKAGYTKNIVSGNDLFYFTLNIQQEDIDRWLNNHEENFTFRTFEKRVEHYTQIAIMTEVKKKEVINENNLYVLFNQARDAKKIDSPYHQVYLEKKAIIQELLPSKITMDLIKSNFNEIQALSQDKKHLLEQVNNPQNKNNKKVKI